jgi:serine/threonine protein kinase
MRRLLANSTPEQRFPNDTDRHRLAESAVVTEPWERSQRALRKVAEQATKFTSRNGRARSDGPDFSCLIYTWCPWVTSERHGLSKVARFTDMNKSGAEQRRQRPGATQWVPGFSRIREVAIKEIVPPRGRVIREDDPEVRRALREARAAAKLSKHPGVITVYDVVTDGGLPLIVMELLHGRSLGDALAADGPMAVDRAARIGIQVLEALDYAHGNGVLHRDVKPGNVMLVGDQVVLTASASR